MKPPITLARLVILNLCGSALSSQSFKNKVTQQGEANNKKFHKHLLDQIANSRKGGTSLIEGISEISANEDGLTLVSTNASTVDADATMQVYLSQYLPTNPVPPSACASALTATVNCNSTITLMAVSPLILGTTEDLTNVCTSACTTSLQTYRSNVLSSCQGYTVQGNNVTYPPTYAVDSIIGPYTTQCLQDPTTLEFCSPLLTSLNTTGGLLALPNSQLCTYCPLKTLNTTLSNLATYTEALADILSSAITQCGSQFASYNVSSGPSAIVVTDPGLAFGTNATHAFSSDCAVTGRNVTATTNTTCSQLATQYNISDNDVLSSNPFLDVNCDIPEHSILCLPQPCQTYTIQLNDTCDSVSEVAGSITGTNITSVQLQSFNPELGTYCQLMALRVGQKICLSPNGGFPNVGVATGAIIPSGNPTALAPIPTPTVSGTTSNCGRYYQVQAGDDCNTVILANAVSLPDFLLLNPEIDANCTNLWLSYFYCVAPFPPLSTITNTIPAGPITSNFSTATLISYPLPTSYTPTFSTITLTAAGVPAPTNIAPGTRTVACGHYYTVATGDTIDSIAAEYGYNATDLLTWNPELSNGSLPIGSAVCTIFPKGNYTLRAAPTPSNLAPNTTLDCAQYYTVVAGDSCPSIEENLGLTPSQFSLLNPGLNARCTNLALGLAYCVLPLVPLSQLGSSSTGPPSNVASGTITEGCTTYYTIASGDSCTTIDSKFNITTAQFITMNPEVNAQCTNIALGSAYCVANSNLTAPSGIPSNVAAGTITAGCTDYYTVISGDSCTTIDAKFNITTAQFIVMNPEVNAQCTNIALGSAYCVASSNSTIPSNVASGTITSGCIQYYTVVSGDSCSAIDTRFGISLAQFISMNPEVNSGCTNIALGSAYCVATSNSTSSIPSNVAAGTITAGCTKYYTIVSGDSCAAIDTEFGITLAQFITMNPEVNSGCTNIALGSAYCVASTTIGSTPPSGPPPNLAAGSLKNCTTYYSVASGDNCPAIETKFHIAASDFFRWNPEVNAACTTIQLGAAYCVAGGGNACSKLYTVQSGDFCSKIITSQGITQARLNALNPWMDANCDLSVGENLCVG